MIPIHFLQPKPLAPLTRRLPHWRLFTAFSSGILMGLAPAPANLWFLAWVALLPLWILVAEGQRSKSIFQLLGYALAWGIGYHGLALSWITGLHPLTWMGVPWLASVAITLTCWIIVTLWGAGITVAWAALTRAVWRVGDYHAPGLRTALLRVLLGTAIWCAVEAFWSQGILYWTSVSYTQSPHNLAILHLGQLSGESAVTAAIVMVNGLLAEAWIALRSRNHAVQARNLLALAAIALVSLHGVGWGLYQQPIADVATASLKVGIVQGNVPTRIKLFEAGQQLAIDRYTQGYNKLVDEGVEAVLTPEGTFPWLWVGRPDQSENPLYQAIRSRGVLAWVGTVGVRQGRITQTLFTITGSGEIFSRYDKAKLVPLGEYVPFESVLGGLIGRLSPVGASMLPGSLNQVVDTPFGRAIAGICYESAFPQLFRRQAAAGGQFILTASNNDPYSAGMMAQHHAQDVMRAIETDRWAVRATNTGFSGIVNPHGETQWISGFRTYETHAHTIYRRQTKTLYVQWGDWLTPFLVIAGLGAWGVAAESRRID